MKGSTYFALSILLLAIVTIILSLQIATFKAKFLPLVLATAIVLFAIARLFVELRGKEAKKSVAEETDSAPIKPIPMIITGAWFVGFFTMIYLVGFPVAIFLFVTAYVKMHHRGWIKSLAFGLGTMVCTYVGFDYLLGLHLYEGVLMIHLFHLGP